MKLGKKQLEQMYKKYKNTRTYINVIGKLVVTGKEYFINKIVHAVNILNSETELTNLNMMVGIDNRPYNRSNDQDIN